MPILNLLCKFLHKASVVISRGIDYVAILYLLTWFWVSVQYFFNYDSFYVPNALAIMHYLDFSFAGWLFLFGHYYKMRSFGKATVLGFTVMLAVNTYQLHYGFTDALYFVSFVGTVFALVMIVYAVCIGKYFIQIYNFKHN